MVFDKAEMLYINAQPGLNDLGVIHKAVRYLDERSKGPNTGIRHKGITGLYKPQRNQRAGKREAEDALPPEIQLFT